MPANRSVPKCLHACTPCRERKVKCSEGQPCGNCYDRGDDCVYPQPQRKKRPRAREQVAHLQDEVSRLKMLLSAATGVDDQSRDSPYRHKTQRSDMHIISAPLEGANETPNPSGLMGISNTTSPRREQNSKPQNCSLPTPHSTAAAQSFWDGCSTLSPNSYQTTNPCNQHVGGTADEEKALDPEKEESIISPKQVNWEHHGPGSWISISSKPGIRLVNEAIGSTEFSEYAKQLMMTWTGRLKLGQGTDRKRAPEPDMETACMYSTAYFQECHDTVFGVVFRPEFESRLQAHFQQTYPADNDPSWYALRNTVYASGCRALLSGTHETVFTDAQVQSWSFFENALSVHTELLYTPTGMMAVQAIALMTFYVEGLGSPALEYMLCSNAARLAQSKGLHRQPTSGWMLSEPEVLHMNWLFWAIYCCEKQIARRSGRPSAIDDNDISCHIPTKVVPGSTIDIEIFHHAIKSAQISSRVSRELSSAGAFRRNPGELIAITSELDRLLQQYRDSLPPYLQPSMRFKPTALASTHRNAHVLYLHYAYYGSLMAIHTTFAYPWVSIMFGGDWSLTFREQVASSINVVAHAARSIIMSLRYIEIDAGAPAWLAFYYPMLALINLFICTLQRPLAPSVQSDIALLEMGTGYFAQLEIATSSALVFPFTRNVAAMARRAIACAKERGIAGGRGANNGSGADASNLCRKTSAVGILNNMEDPVDIDFDLDNWNTFLSTMGDDFSSEGDILHFLDDMGQMV